MYAEGRLGYIDILSVNALTPSPVPLTFDVYSDDQLMWVHLDEDLHPETSVILEIAFESVLPTNSSDRGGVSGSDLESSKMYEFASAYPIPCVYDEYDGWNTDPYLDVGDPFYLDMAYYTFNLTLPNDMVVAASGELVGITAGVTNTTYRYAPAHPVREITFCASRYYIVESQIHNGVNVSSYYLPESISLWSTNGLAWGIKSLSLFSDAFGLYSYTTLNIVEDSGFYYGMEYPCQVYLSNIITDRYNHEGLPASVLESVIAHEVAHQWWYHLVGNDEIDVGFLDEGLTVWSVYLYSDYYELGWGSKADNFYTTRLNFPAIINQSIYDDSSTYYLTAYTKTPVVLEKLRQIIGIEDFLDSLRLFFQRFSFRIAFLQDLQSAFEDQTGMELDWFFVPMFDNGYLPDYSFNSVQYDKNSMSLTIVIDDLNEEFHVRRYTQNFRIEVETSSQDVVFVTVQLFGTTQFTIIDSSFYTNTPTMVTLVYDHYSLVQINDWNTDSLNTTDIITVTPTTPTTSTTPTTQNPADPGVTDFTLYILASVSFGVIVLVVFVLVQKKNRL